MTDPDIARLEQKVADHDRRITNVERMQEQMVELNRQNTKLIEQVGNMRCDVGDLKNDFKDVKATLHAHVMEPADSWKKLKWLVVAAAVTMLATLVATILGLTGG